IATVVTPQSRSQSARTSRSTVNVPKRRTGSGERSGGTATQCSASPISIPAAWGLESGSEEDGRSTKGSGTVGTGGQGSGNASFEGVIRPPEVNTHTAEHHGGRRDEATCSLPNGIRPKPVASDVVATSRDQPNKRAHSTSAGTVTTTHGVLVRIARNGATGSVPLRCVAAQPPKPLTKRCSRCLQPPLLRRGGFHQRLSANVRCQEGCDSGTSENLLGKDERS